jgi:pentatricopeptide repeat protein
MTTGLSVVSAEEDLLQLGKTYMEAGNYEEAVKTFNSMIKQKINLQEAYFKGAEAYYKLGQYGMSLAYCNIGIQKDPSNAPASIYLLIGKGQMKFNHDLSYAEALQALTIAAEKEPNNAEIHHIKGGALYALSRFEEALASFNSAIALNSEVPLYYLGKGYALMDLARNEEAVMAFEEGLKRDRANYSLTHYKGEALYSLGRFEEALKEFINADLLKKDDKLENDIFAGKTLSVIGENTKAMDLFEQLAINYPSDTMVFTGYGEALANMGLFNEALAQFDKAIMLDPNNDMAYDKKGLTLMVLGKFNDSLVCFDKAIQLKPKHYISYVHKATSLFYLGKYDEAIKSYDAAINNKINNILVYYQKGRVLYEMKKYADANMSFDKALSIDGNHILTLESKAFTLNQLKKFSDAIAISDKVIKLNANEALPYISKGQALAGLNKYKDAITLIDNGLKLNVKLPIGYFEKGNVLVKMNDLEGAIKNYDLALSYDPNNNTYKEAKNSAIITYAKKNKGLSLDKTYLSLNVGKSEKLTVNVLKGYSSNVQLIWTSSNPKIAIVDKAGNIKGITAGEVVIYATSSDKKIKLFSKVIVTK